MNFSNDYKMKIATWEKKLPEIVKDDNNKWIAKNHKKIYEYITTHYENKKHVKRAYISVIRNSERIRYTARYTEEIFKIATDLNLELQTESKKQELLPQRKQNFVFFQDVVKRREDFRKLFEHDKPNNKNNLSWVLLSLYTMQPPIRMEYKNMKVVTALPKNTKQNFLLNKNNKYYVVIRDDKVVKSQTRSI